MSTQQLSSSILSIVHPSERAALKAKLSVIKAQQTAKAQIVAGKFWGTFAVEYPSGHIEQCHNIATARTLCKRYNQPLS